MNDNNKIDSEEIDLTSIIKEIKLLFQSIGRFFKTTFISIGNLFTYLLSKFKLISLIALIGGLLGFLFHYTQDTTFQSSLVLKMNVDAREQLANDISYFSSLIEDKEINELANILSISLEDASTINEIEIIPHIPEIEKLKNYNSIYTTLDSNLRDIIGLDFEMVNTTSNLSYITDKFVIVVTSVNPKVFAKIEPRLIDYISKSYELNQKLEIELAELQFREKTLIKQIADLDTLKKVLNNVLVEESKTKSTQAQTTIQLNQSEKDNDFDILEVHKRSQSLADQLAEINTKISKLNNVYTIESHFSEYGQVNSLTLTVKILIGISLGVVFSVLFLIIKLTPKQL